MTTRTSPVPGNRDRPHALFAPERLEFVLRQLAARGRIDAARVATELGVSNESIRKDLALLERRGLLRRVHGGAIPLHELRAEPPMEARTSLSAEKDVIARAALAHVPTGGSVLLDAGSTTARLAELLPADQALFVCTNSLPVASILTTRTAATVRLLGGTVRRPSLAGVGQVTLDGLAMINVDVAFLGTNGVSLQRGLTTPDEQEGIVKHAMLATARRRILLADHSKIGRENLCRYAELTDLDVLITDDGIADHDAQAIEAAGVEVQIAERAS